MYPLWLKDIIDSGVKLTTGKDAEKVLQYVQSTKDKKLYERLFMKNFQQDTELGKALNLLNKAKKVPIGTVHNGMQKVAEGKWEPVKTGASKQPKDRVDETTAVHHEDEAKRHMSESVKNQELASKIEDKIKARKKVDPNYKVPEAAQKVLDEIKAKAKGHAEDHKAKKQRADDSKSDVEATRQTDSVKESKKKQSDKNKNAKLEESAQESKTKPSTVQDFSKLANEQYDSMESYSKILNDLENIVSEHKKKDVKFKVSPQAKELIESVKTNIKFHKNQYNEMKKRSTQNYKVSVEPKLKSESLQTSRAKDSQDKIDQKKNERKINKGKLMIAMQDHEAKEQYRADKPKEGKVEDPRPQVEKADKKKKKLVKGGQGSGPKGDTHEDQMAKLNAAYENYKAKVTKNPSDKHSQMWLNKLQAKMQALAKLKKSRELVRALLKGGQGSGRAGHETSLTAQHLNKSVIQADEQSSVINTADSMIELNEALKDDWYLQFKGLMDGYNYGDTPRTLKLSNGYSIILSKVDDGLYSGFIRQEVDWDGESPLEETVSKVEKQTLPAIIAFLKAKEYIDPSAAELEDKIEDVVEITSEVTPQEEVSLQSTDEASQDKLLAMKLINLLDRLV